MQEDTSKFVDVFDSSVRSAFWWAYWIVIRALARVLTAVIGFADSCCCHWKLLQLDLSCISPLIIALWRTCPFRGFNGSGISNGEALELVFKLVRTTGAEVVYNRTTEQHKNRTTEHQNNDADTVHDTMSTADRNTK